MKKIKVFFFAKIDNFFMTKKGRYKFLE